MCLLQKTQFFLAATLVVFLAACLAGLAPFLAIAFLTTLGLATAFLAGAVGLAILEAATFLAGLLDLESFLVPALLWTDFLAS